MEKVWLSTVYYLDPKIMGLSADAERVFVRSIAYSGAAETRGFVPDSALTQLGNKRGSRPIQELIRAELWTKVPGGYQISGWSNWQKNGDDLVQRKRTDRERKRRQREREAEESRDMSRDVTPTEKRREEKSTGTSKSAAYVPDVGAHPSRGATGPAVPVNGWGLVRDTIPAEHPQATRTALAIEAAELLTAGTPEPDVIAALQLWLTKPRAGPRLLPNLVSDVIKSRATPIQPAAGAVTEKVNGWLDIANQAHQIASQQKALEQ